METGSIHLGYEVHPEKRLREILICDLIEEAARAAGRSKEEFRVLDMGCGSGHLMKTAGERGLDVKGADIDPVCVRLSSHYAETFLVDGDRMEGRFEKESFDCLVFSHSLEHFDSPLEAVRQARLISRDFLIFAVPNPCRLQTILAFNPLCYDYSNLGHLCCWDRSHLNVFLTRRCGLKILKWQPYKVGVPAVLPSFLKALMRKRPKRSGVAYADIPELQENGKKKHPFRIVKKSLEPVEIFLGRMFPYFADEFLVLCEIPHGEQKTRNTLANDPGASLRGYT